MTCTNRIKPVAAAVLLALSATPAFAVEGDPVGSDFQLNTYTTADQDAISHAGDIAMDANGNFVAVWTDRGGLPGIDGIDIAVRRYAADGTARDANELRVNTTTAGDQQSAQVAVAPGGDFVVVFADANGLDGDSGGVFARCYAADGTPKGDQFAVNAHTVGDQSTPDVAMAADGSFVVVWTGDDAADSSYSDGYDIFARPFDADGNALGSEVRVNTATTDMQNGAQIAMDAAGNYIVVWQDNGGADGSGRGIMARRFQRGGYSPDSSDVVIPNSTTGNQQVPYVAMDATGHFVVTWNDYQSGHTGGYAKVFNADASVRIGEYPFGHSARGVAMDADGDFAVALGGGDSDGELALLQRYDLAGNTVGGQYTFPKSGLGEMPSGVAMDADGDTVLLATEYEHGGSDYGVFAQRYEGAGRTVDLGIVGSDDSSGALIPGDSLTYSFTVTNSGSNSALALTLADTLPAGMTLNGYDSMDSWDCPEPTGSLVTCTLPLLASGASSSIDLYVTTDSVTDSNADNSATIGNAVDDANTTDNSDTVTTAFIVDNVAPTFDATPTISGTATVGNTLSVANTATTDLNGDSVTLSYQWLLDGAAISGATDATYTVQSDDIGSELSVTVTADDGHGGTASATSAAVTATAESDSTSTSSGSGGGGAFGWLSLFAGLLLFRRRA